MYSGLVAVERVGIASPGSEVYRTAYLLVKEYVAHSLVYIRIDAERKLADVSCSVIGVEYRIDSLGIVRRRLDYLAVLEYETHVFELDTVLDGRNVIMYDAVDTVANGRGIHFAVGNIPKSAALDRPDILDRERQIRIVCDKTHLIRPIHQRN